MKVSRILQILHLDEIKQKPKKEKTPQTVLRYLEERTALARKLLTAPSKVNPFAAMHPKDVCKLNGTYHKLRNEALQFLKPLSPQLMKHGCTAGMIADVASDVADQYMRYSRENHVMGRLSFAQFVVAHLYIRADIPIWLALLPQIREAKILPNWAPFYKLFNETMAVMKDLSPTLYRQQFRGMYNADAFKYIEEGQTLELQQPSSSSQHVSYAEEFMHKDKPHVVVNAKGVPSAAWDAKSPPTKGDNLMQIWDVQDSVSNARIWECESESEQQTTFIQKGEHLLLEGTKMRVLLKATAVHPKSHRPVTFVVAQDVRSKALGQQDRLLEALHLDKGELC